MAATPTGVVETRRRTHPNVKTFAEWKICHRHVRRGERGTRLSAWMDTRGTPVDGDMIVVFDISQTEPDQEWRKQQ